MFAFVAAIWSPRGVPIAVGMAALTGCWRHLAAGSWPRCTQVRHQTIDLVADLAANLAWAAFAGLAGATILRERLSRLLPHR